MHGRLVEVWLGGIRGRGLMACGLFWMRMGVLAGFGESGRDGGEICVVDLVGVEL